MQDALEALLDAQSDAAAPVPASAATLPAVVTIRDAALAQFTKTEADLRALAERYREVAYDVASPKGMDAAKKARQELREGRYAVQRVEQRVKDEANDLKRTIKEKAEALVGIVAPIEESVDSQIKAREAVIAAEKAAREAAEAERCKRHTDRIAKMAGWIEQAAGKPFDALEKGIAFVQAIDTSAAQFEEYAQEATDTKARVLAALRAMLVKAQADEATRAAAVQAEAEAARLRAEVEELKRQQALREHAAAVVETTRDTLMSESLSEITLTNLASAPVVHVPEGVHTLAADTIVPSSVTDNGALLPTAAVVTVTGVATLATGELCRRLGLIVTVEFLRSLGIEPVAREKAASKWAVSDLPAIRDALIAHLWKVIP